MYLIMQNRIYILATTKRLRQQPAVRRERLVAAAGESRRLKPGASPKDWRRRLRLCGLCSSSKYTHSKSQKPTPRKKREAYRLPYPLLRRYFGTTKYGLSTPCTKAARRTDIRLHESRFATRSNEPSSAKTRRNTPASESSGISRHVLISAPPQSGHASASSCSH